MNQTVTEILNKLNITKWNQLQEAAFKSFSKGKNTIILAPTGSGKTLAFLLPILTSKTPTLILTPTRELAIQIHDVIKKSKAEITSALCYGGHSFTKELNILKEQPKLVIGTPGRILDHIDKETIAIDVFSHLILDEYDKSLEMGFEDQINKVYDSLNNPNITLASATELNKENLHITRQDFSEINYLDQQKPDLKFFQVTCAPEEKMEHLSYLLKSLGAESSIVFCNHREVVNRLEEMLFNTGIHVSKFHGGLDQVERERAIIKFQNNTCNILICTDLAARGLDIDNINNVIHYQLPIDHAQFIHRNGRTARQGKKGKIYFILKDGDQYQKFTEEEVETLDLTKVSPQKYTPAWSTLFIGAGKKDKISKGDVAGFLIKQGKLEMKQIGRIDIKDNFCYVAVQQSKIFEVLKKIKGERLKKKKPKIEISK